MSNTQQADTFVSVPNSLLVSTEQVLSNISRQIEKHRVDIIALTETNARLMLELLARDRVIGELRDELRRADARPLMEKAA